MKDQFSTEEVCARRQFESFLVVIPVKILQHKSDNASLIIPKSLLKKTCRIILPSPLVAMENACELHLMSIKLDDILEHLRREFLTKYEFYVSVLTEDDMSVLAEVNNF